MKRSKNLRLSVTVLINAGVAGIEVCFLWSTNNMVPDKI